jgi:hypothetical protein
VALSRSIEAVLMTPSPCERRLSVSTRALDARGRVSNDASLHGNHAPLLVAFHDLGDKDRPP